MKPFLLLLAVASLFLQSIAVGAETAPATLYCLSIRVFQCTNIYGDAVKVNSSGGGPQGENELIASQSPGIDISWPWMNSYASGSWIYDSAWGHWYSGTIYLNPPDFTDTNNNKFPDFFEVSCAVSSATAPGSYSYYDTDFGDYFAGNISIVWNRPAGSKDGTIQLVFSEPYWGTFYGTFEILEYDGTVSYTPGLTNVTGTLNLTQAGSNNTYQGSVSFVKSDTNRFDSLILQAGTLTDASAQANYFTNHYFFRDEGWPTNYAGYIEFDDDGDQNSFYPWAMWVLSINDTNDVNKNAIPDFSDDPSATPPPRQPQLSLLPTSTNILLTIHGDTGHTHTIQQEAAFGTGTWQLYSSFVLTNDPTVVPVPTSGNATYLRVFAQ